MGALEIQHFQNPASKANQHRSRVGFKFERGWLMRIRFTLLVVLAFFFSLVGAHSVSAQATANAQLNGTVTDPSGASVANAMITVTNTATNAKYAATTNQNGFYA